MLMKTCDLPAAIGSALDSLPPALLSRSGSVFYTGWQSLLEPSPLYILGLNPGGDPVAQSGNTIAKHIAEFRECQEPWSAYADESWEGSAPGS